MSAIGGSFSSGGLIPPDDPAEVEDAAPAQAAAPVARGGKQPAVSFTEEMHGTLVGPDLAAGRGENFRLHLTIDTGDMDKFLGSPEHLGGAMGYIDAPGLGGQLPRTRPLVRVTQVGEHGHDALARVALAVSLGHHAP